MVLYINNYPKGQDDEFVLKCIPSIIASRMLSNCSTKNTKAMDNYLNKMYEMSTYEIVEKVGKHIKTSWVSDLCQISIDTNALEEKSGQTIKSLIKLIDYGNIDVKGLNIFKESLMFIQAYINSIYRLYRYSNGRKEN